MNKKQLIQKVKSLGCTVEIDLENSRYQTIHIIAPTGQNFGGNHELVTAWQSGKAFELYDEAYQDLIGNVLSKCACDNCGSWIGNEQGYCEYWEAGTHG